VLISNTELRDVEVTLKGHCPVNRKKEFGKNILVVYCKTNQILNARNG
jgi:hypothetical protein